MENLEQEIISLLRERPMISEEIRDKLMEKGVRFTPLELRETLATMVREGKIEKYPDYDRRKFYFRLRSDNF
ncbi:MULTISPECIES: hypothetical protein [Metallosphaera]|uniref:Transcriptional regulator n=3 Tax=Metallosphaera TaxID=41980 RepID=A4YIR1_METS5|nr:MULTISPECIES: hypothetical protein [Metallosphaera]ABP96313.1 hypothetical protein Msed_2174 [Metallosphaera sedula DSM 5348]AIM28296.1 hypothetical protein HA72_2174 [Metallosphaera sedula]AKV75097.1 hypothetical protein MsedA_2226 [Metallosphaera sedula]AKV77335.1 hypothetical protein MsedB_2228 [Metallosphaera sedula]AKV79586.1 hypothetical protein MsedC_2226 [Metallosphaera sedula]